MYPCESSRQNHLDGLYTGWFIYKSYWKRFLWSYYTKQAMNREEGHSYIIEDMDVRQGLSNPYPLQRQNFGPFANKWRKIFENIYPKTPENEFLAVYLCIIEKFHKSLCYLIRENYDFTEV